MKYSKYFAQMLKEGSFDKLDITQLAILMNIVYAEGQKDENAWISRKYNKELYGLKGFAVRNLAKSKMLSELTAHQSPEYVFQQLVIKSYPMRKK